ncbi:substrate-binding domain-containing protein [Falsiroseomonas sp. E2-1-a4]|uniref:substrate-binding domain-containing protein n=1 Tax=Falsiroseomonas sp. E2-1-a4 TaxID=3239299 RepID=UPI003F3B4AD4
MTPFRRTSLVPGDGLPGQAKAITRREVLVALPLLAALPPRHARAADAAPLRLGGTGMGLAITRLLLHLHGGTEDLPDVMVLPSLGTAGGLAALAAGRIDLAVVSRALNASERAAGLAETPFARTPIAFATRHDTPVEGLTLAEAAAMLSGATPDWPRGGPVRLVRRDRSETDWILAGAASPIVEAALARAHGRPGLALAASDQDNAELLESLPGSFGLTTLGQTRAEHRRLRLLALDGAVPEIAAMRSGQYRLARGLHLAWRRDAPALVAGFAGFLATPRAHQALLDFGFAPPARPQ